MDKGPDLLDSITPILYQNHENKLTYHNIYIG